MNNKDEFLKKVGENIKNIRNEKGFEIKKVAADLGISPQAYGKIENGKVDLNITRLYEISHYYQIEFNKLLQSTSEIYNYTSHHNSGGYSIKK